MLALAEDTYTSRPHRKNLDRWRPPLVEAGAPFARFSLYMQIVHTLPTMPFPMNAPRMLSWIRGEAKFIKAKRILGSTNARNILAAAEGVRFEFIDGMWREKETES